MKYFHVVRVIELKFIAYSLLGVTNDMGSYEPKRKKKGKYLKVN